MNINNTTNTFSVISQTNFNKNLIDENLNENKKEVNLSDKEKAQVDKLKKEDQRVRTHEQAHKSAAGNLSSGGPNYTYKVGPDGKRYAVAGDVHIDSAEVPNDPEATVSKAQKIKAAALAPAEPSQQDLKVAAQARKMEMKAKQELLKKTNDNSSDEKISYVYKKEENKARFDFTI